MLSKFLKKLDLLIRRILIGLIRIYQKTLSFDQGILAIGQPICRFRPTCSQYMIEAIEQFGLAKGIFLGIKRMAKCHPFSQGGWDPIKIKM